MSTQQLASRFSIAKNAQEYLRTEEGKAYLSAHPEFSGICPYSEYSYEYRGDADFQKYFRGSPSRIEQFHTAYPEIELFLKNIDWDGVYATAETSAKSLVTELQSTGFTDASLVIVHAFPIHMVLLGEAIRLAGFDNVVYNFNRNAFINSAARNFEAFLLLSAHANSAFFRERTASLASSLKETAEWLKRTGSFVIFDENDRIPELSTNRIDPYLQTQIGFQSPRNVYRLDKYPAKEFLDAKGIKRIVFLDSDDSAGSLMDTYRSKMGIEYVGKRYQEPFVKTLGAYEAYLEKQNVEFLGRKAGIVAEVEAQAARNAADTAYAPSRVPASAKKPKAKAKKSSDGNLNEHPFGLLPGTIRFWPHGVYLLAFPVLSIAFLSSENPAAPTKTTGTGSSSTTHHHSYWGSSTNWGGGSWGSSSSSSIGSSSRSSSSVSSFGGGGFSKGGG